MIAALVTACVSGGPPPPAVDERLARATDSGATTDPLPGWCDWSGTEFVEIDGTFDAALDACLGTDSLDDYCGDRFEPGAGSACPTFLEYVEQIGWLDPLVARDAYVVRCVRSDGSPVDRVWNVWFAPTGEMLGSHEIAAGPPPESGEAGTCFTCDGRVTFDAWWGAPVDAVCTGDGTWEYTPQDFGAPATERGCVNGADDDFDGVGDCLDPDCAAAPECRCTTLRVDEEPPFQLEGITTGERNCNEPPGACSFAGGGGSDATFEIVAPWKGLYTFDTIGTSWDTVLYARDPKGLDSLGCNDSYGEGDCGGMLAVTCAERESRIELELDRGQHILLVVDGARADASGPFVVNVSGSRGAGDHPRNHPAGQGCGCHETGPARGSWLAVAVIAGVLRRKCSKTATGERRRTRRG